jgi:hypothetical protein
MVPLMLVKQNLSTVISPAHDREVELYPLAASAPEPVQRLAALLPDDVPQRVLRA